MNIQAIVSRAFDVADALVGLKIYTVNYANGGVGQLRAVRKKRDHGRADSLPTAMAYETLVGPAITIEPTAVDTLVDSGGVVWNVVSSQTDHASSVVTVNVVRR